MLNLFLLIALILFVLLLLAFILPIRFGAFAKYSGTGSFYYQFFVSYCHPLLLKFLYSSEEGGTLKIVGKTVKLKQKEAGGEPSENVGDNDEKTTASQESETEYSSSDYEEESGYESESAQSQNEEAVSVEEAGGSGESQEKQTGLFDKIKKRMEKIKKSKAYRFVSDKVWREKIIAWLGRVLNGALSVIVFKRLRVRAKVGLMNPAVLGKLCGYFSAARSALSLRRRKVDMSLEPLFMREYLEFEVELKGGTSLLRAVSCLVAAVFTFPYIRTYRIWRRKTD